MRAIILLSICLTMIFANSHNIKLDTPDGQFTITCPEDQYILDCAEANGINLPPGCRCGADPSSAGKLVGGIIGQSVDQSDQSYLNDQQIQAGFVMLDVAYAMSDCEILTNQEEALF